MSDEVMLDKRSEASLFASRGYTVFAIPYSNSMNLEGESVKSFDRVLWFTLSGEDIPKLGYFSPTAENP